MRHRKINRRRSLVPAWQTYVSMVFPNEETRQQYRLFEDNMPELVRRQFSHKERLVVFIYLIMGHGRRWVRDHVGISERLTRKVYKKIRELYG